MAEVATGMHALLKLTRKKMKSILIIGKSEEGKSTTMREVCRRLQPTEVFKLVPNIKFPKESVLENSDLEKVFNDSFIVKFNGKFILVVAGSPTEQNVTLAILIQICASVGIKIVLCLVSKRIYERKEGFDTVRDLELNTKLLYSEKIRKIISDDYQKDPEWNDRIDKIVGIIKENI